jgi:anti-sigma factor RsiW
MIMDSEHMDEHPSPERLQRYFDGELMPHAPHEPDEPNAVRAHIADCPQCSAQQRSLARLHSLVAMTAESDAQELDSERLFAAIERGIAADDTPASPAHVSGSSAQPLSKKVVPLRRLHWLSNAAPVLGALALAAAAMLMVYRPDGQGDAGDETFEAPEGHSEVVEVDFGSNAGTVFDISLSDGSSVPVVWIDDDEEE